MAIYCHDGDLKNYRAPRGLLSENEVIGLIALLLFLAGMVDAFGAELQLEQGQCLFSGGGAFYQTDSEHHNYLTPRCTSLGLADKFKASAMGYRIAYIVTGDIEARDNVVVMNDFGLRNSPCVPPNYDGCKATINGSGHMRGVSFSGTGDLRLGPITVIGEFGLLFFKSQFKAVATLSPGHTGEINEESRWTDQPTPLLGLGVRYGPVYVSARHYWPAEHRAISLTNHAFTQLSLGLAARIW